MTLSILRSRVWFLCPTKGRGSPSLPRGNRSDRDGRLQAPSRPPLDWLDLNGGGVRQLWVKACISLIWGIWMLYSDVKSIFDSTPRGICQCSHTWKTSLTAPLDSKDARDPVRNWLLYSGVRSMFATPLNSEDARGIVGNWLLQRGAISVFDSTPKSSCVQSARGFDCCSWTSKASPISPQNR